MALDYSRLGDAYAQHDKEQSRTAYAKASALWGQLRGSGRLPPKYADSPAAMRENVAWEFQ
jgi:hypothetical protein